jgi:hypothetical protein
MRPFVATVVWYAIAAVAVRKVIGKCIRKNALIFRSKCIAKQREKVRDAKMEEEKASDLLWGDF